MRRPTKPPSDRPNGSGKTSRSHRRPAGMLGHRFKGSRECHRIEGDRISRHLRRIRFKDPETGKSSSPFRVTLPALTICALRKSRWRVELFFKWTWIAVSAYVLVAIVRKRLRLEMSLYTLLQVFSVTVFEKIPIQTAILAISDRSDDAEDSNQFELFTFGPDTPDTGDIVTVSATSPKTRTATRDDKIGQAAALPTTQHVQSITILLMVGLRRQPPLCQFNKSMMCFVARARVA
jgi:hypothetical protein